MKRWNSLAAAALAMLTLASCGGDANNDSAIRVIHAAPDAPRVNFLLNGQSVRFGLDYRQGTPLLLLTQGSYDVAIEGLILPENQTVVTLPGLAFMGDRDYTIVVTGQVADDSLDGLVFETSRIPAPDGKSRIQVLHAAPAAPAVDIYVTEPDAELATRVPVGTLAYREDTGALDVDAGLRRVRVTLAGDPANVVYDSPNITLAQNSKLFIVAVANTGAGPAPISLVVNTGAAQADLLDRNTPAALRVLQLSPDAPALDLTRQATGSEDVLPFIDGLLFPQSSGYRELAGGQYTLRARDAGDPEADPLLSFLQTVLPGQFYTVLLTGLVEGLLGQSLIDARRPIATEAKLRLVHASPEAGLVDIYLTPAGAELSDSVLILRNVSPRVETGYRSLQPGDYTLLVTAPADSTAVVISAPLSLAGGDVRTLAVTDAAGGGEPIGLSAFDDTAD